MMLGCVSLLATLWLDIGSDTDATALRLKSRWSEAPAADAEVRYRLDQGYADGTWTNGAFQTEGEFVIELAQARQVGFYRVVAEVVSKQNTYVHNGFNAIALTWIPMSDDAEFRRIPVLFEQPAEIQGSEITISTLLKCNSFSGGELFWGLDLYGRPCSGWRANVNGGFEELPRYRIGASGWERLTGLETVLPFPWMLKPGPSNPEVAGFWLCGQYLNPMHTSTLRVYYAKAGLYPESWNKPGFVYFSVPYVQGLALDDVKAIGKNYGEMEYLMPDGRTGSLSRPKGGNWPETDLPQMLNLGGLPSRGLPFGSVYRLLVTNGYWSVGFSNYGFADELNYKAGVRICVSTKGEDRYSDGTPIRDGECYAVVKAAAETERIEFTEDGHLADPTQRLVAILPLAKDGRLPETVLEFDSQLSDDELTGDYFLCRLDTRLDDQRLAPLTDDGRVPTYVNGGGTLTLVLADDRRSFLVSTNSNFDACVCGPAGSHGESGLPEAGLPQIGSFKVTETNILLTVENMDQDSEYFVVPAKRIDAFEAPLTNRPIGKVFNLPKQDGHRFFRIIRQPKKR